MIREIKHHETAFFAVTLANTSTHSISVFKGSKTKSFVAKIDSVLKCYAVNVVERFILPFAVLGLRGA